MAKTTKDMSKLDFEQVLKGQYVDELASTMTTGFVQGKVGHKVLAIDISATVIDFEYYDGSTLLMTIEVEYADASQEKVIRAERII
jgi:hypothetical protein